MTEQEIELSGSFESPESSTIAGASYDASTETLTVRFRRAKGENVYRYQGIPPHIWQGFLEAPSKGQFFAGRIRPIYDGKKLD